MKNVFVFVAIFLSPFCWSVDSEAINEVIEDTKNTAKETQSLQDKKQADVVLLKQQLALKEVELTLLKKANEDAKAAVEQAKAAKSSGNLDEANKAKAEAEQTLNNVVIRSEENQELDYSQYFSFGLAVLNYSSPYVKQAEVLGGNVRITDTVDQRITPWLQAQYIFDGWWPGSSHIKPGIFVGVGLGSESNFLETFGIGGMISMKRTSWGDKVNTGALNIGLGVYTSKVQKLADGIEEGQPLPTGVESIRFKTESDVGIMLNLSFSI